MKFRSLLANDDAALYQHGAELIDQRGALFDKPVAHRGAD
jgi:hypothetical protein